MSLNDKIHQLIDPHPLIRPDGTWARDRNDERIYQPALLDQLATAQMSQRQGGSGSNEIRIPINAAAIELWKQLDTEVRQVTLDRYGHAKGHMGALLERWKDEGEPAWEAHLEHIAMDIIDRIQTMFEPPPKRRPLRQACPACGEYWVLNADGDREMCLTAGTHNDDGTLKTPGEFDVNCSSCAAEWRGEQMAWLLKAVDVDLMTSV